jgi:hypothetical protein
MDTGLAGIIAPNLGGQGFRKVMCRISPVGDDWVKKGCHVHVGAVELVLRPDHLGGIVFRSPFSSTLQWEIDAAARLVTSMLDNPIWRSKLKETIEKAMIHLMGVQGSAYVLARGRLFELRKLIRALERWENK